MSDYTPTPKLPDFFAPIPMSGALTYTPTTKEVRHIEDLSEGQCEAGVMVKGVWHRCVQSIHHKGWSHRNPDAEIVWITNE